MVFYADGREVQLSLAVVLTSNHSHLLCMCCLQPEQALTTRAELLKAAIEDMKYTGQSSRDGDVTPRVRHSCQQ